MKTPGSIPLLPGLVAVLVCSTAGRTALAEVEPRWMRMEIPQVSVGMEVESLTEDVNSGGATSSHEQLSLVPLVGLRTRGSIYHPKLLSFDLSGETGWGWVNDSFTSQGSSSTRNEEQSLLRYLVDVNILSGLPYNASFYASQDHTYRNYDSFSSFIVDSTRYGGRVNWTTATLNLSAEVGTHDETARGFTDTSRIEETFFNFTALQRRTRGQSSLNYRFNQYDNTFNGGIAQRSVNNSVGVSDSETFGSRAQLIATSGASFSQYEYSGHQTETFTANETLMYNHRPKLDSSLYANFSHSSMDTAQSSFLQGAYQIRHRLYESLTSSLNISGSHDENTSASAQASNERYGVGIGEDYTKRLWSLGRLSIRGGISVNHENHEATGSVLTVIDEPHQLYLPANPSYQPVYLNNPRVIRTSIQVVGPSGLAAENADYQILPQGELTEIRLVVGSFMLHDGDNVKVSYNSESLYNAAFETVNGNVEIRLDLFGKFGVYARMNTSDNNAPPQTLTEKMTDTVFGADFSWRGVRASAEHEDHDSNFTKYQALRFNESYSFSPTAASSFSVDFAQIFYHYPDNGDQTQYQFLSRFNSQLTYSLAWYLEGGFTLQDIVGTEQNYGSARTGLTWARDKLNVRAGYQYNYQRTSSGTTTEQRERNFFFAYLKRYF